jgi:hypothetical protein
MDYLLGDFSYIIWSNIFTFTWNIFAWLSFVDWRKIMIYLDMDGVLAHFNEGMKNLGIPVNKQWFEPKELWTEETLAGEKIKEAHMHTKGFWLNIPPMGDAKELWDFVSSYTTPIVLTAKPRDDSPVMVDEEKYEWINKYMGPHPREAFICCTRSEKSNFVGHTNHKFQILVDDDKRNCVAWEQEGGIAVHHTDAKTSISKLKKIFNKYEGEYVEI